MYAAEYIFSNKFFVAWVVVSIIWVWGTMLIAGFFPIIDGWRQIRLVFRGLSSGPDEMSSSDSVEVVETKGPTTKAGKGNDDTSS